MELHEHFMKIAGLESSIVEAIESIFIAQDSVDSIIGKSIEDCFNKLKTCFTKEHMELLRLLLCQQYKLNYKHAKNKKTSSYAKFSQFVEFVTSDKLCTNKENQIILYDILILHLILSEDQQNFINLFEDFKTYNTLNQSKAINKLSKDYYLKILNCFLEAWDVLYFLHSSEEPKIVNKTHLESCKKVIVSSIMYDLQTWIQCKETIQLHTLHSVLSKVISIEKNTKILDSYICQVINTNSDLTTMCVLCDLVFPIGVTNIDVNFSLIFNENLWSLIQNKLISPQSPDRKQALYFFKRIIDFIDINEENIKSISLHLDLKNNVNLFICNQISSNNHDIKQIRTNFILIMEALEEKQKHLVIPSLSLVDSLIDGCSEHELCRNCFDLSWIHCVFARILEHDNNSVTKWGLLKLLKLNARTYNCDSIIRLIVKYLNNTFLYEKNNDESDPKLSNALITWFDNLQNFNPNLIQKFIHFLSEISWGPIPIFHTLNSLLLASDKFKNITIWQKEQLDAIRSVVQTNIKLHPPMLRSISQVILIKIILRFYEINLTVLSNLLTIFSEKDVKESYCWFDLTTWVAKVHYDVAVDFISEICKNLQFNDANVKISIPVFSLIIQLLFEGKVICQREQCLVTQDLTTLFLCLDKIDIRPYVQISFIIKIIDLICNLINSQRPIPKFILQFFIKYKETIFKFILKLFYNDNFNYEQAQICIKALENIDYSSENKINNVLIITNNNSKDLEEKCIQVLSNANKHNEIQLLFALQLWSSISNCYRYEDDFLFEIVTNLLQIPKSKNYHYNLKGKIGLDYYTALSKLIRNHILTLNTSDLTKNDKWLNVLSSILDASGNQVLVYFADIMHLYSTSMTNGSEILENFKFLLRSFWNCNFASKREKVFWIVTQKLTKCINSSNFFNCKYLQDIPEEFTNRMLSEGDLLQGLKYILLTCSEIKNHFNRFMEAILNGLLHGQVLRRDQRISMQAYMKSKNLLSPYKLRNEKIENFMAYDFINRQCNVDTTVRAAAVLQLSKALDFHNENTSLFLPLVLEKLSTIQKKRYFADSQLHRLKHRIFQVLLILQPYLNKESTEILYHVLCDSVIQDTDQHSIRLMKEWLLIKIYLSNENLFPDLWLFFDKVYNERAGSASSVIGIIWHIAQQLNKEKNSEFIKTALLKLGTCCMGQQFGMRLFGQIFFAKLYELLDEDCDIKLEYSSFYKATLQSLNSGNVKKSPIKIDEDFFYTIFDPFKHYSLETIYHHLPRLCNVSFEEWITKEIFEEQLSLESLSVNLKISNCDKLLDQAEIPYSILKSNEHSKSEEIECSQTATDIQKKITPWKTMLPNDEDLKEMVNLSSLKNEMENKQEIIVVASLVDKPQNLGGIARTCEIFGVKELVISNCKLIEEKEFQALSVSADKWIKITEVKSFLLDKYLLELKNCGWTVIGAEQTANSVSLYDLKFPNRTTLVLGNEKNGIPANIIPLLDICVEIPQYGIIRSLNVHVTSAICIWEYIKQRQSTT